MPVPPPDYWLTDEENSPVGQVTAIALHTPGHTPGSMSFHVPEAVSCLAGDTLFRGSIGRTDLWGGDFDAIERSILDRLYTLDDSTLVVTGHGPETEIGWEKRGINSFVHERIRRSCYEDQRSMAGVVRVVLCMRLPRRARGNGLSRNLIKSRSPTSKCASPTMDRWCSCRRKARRFRSLSI